jgi:hypothetical protein
VDADQLEERRVVIELDDGSENALRHLRASSHHTEHRDPPTKVSTNARGDDLNLTGHESSERSFDHVAPCWVLPRWRRILITPGLTNLE